MKQKRLLLLIILLAGIFFVVSMVIGTNSYVKSAKDNSTHYFDTKELFVAGNVIDREKISGRNQLIELTPTSYKNSVKDSTNSMGFITKDTSKMYIVLNVPKELDKVDSLVTTSKETTFYVNGIEIGKSEPELMRWATMQFWKIETEKRTAQTLEYIY